MIINSGVLPAVPWRPRPGASRLQVSFPGTGVPGVGRGAGVVQENVLAARKVAPTAPQLGQTDIHNYMTSVVAVGEGALGPPPDRESA